MFSRLVNLDRLQVTTYKRKKSQAHKGFVSGGLTCKPRTLFHKKTAAIAAVFLLIQIIHVSAIIIAYPIA